MSPLKCTQSLWCNLSLCSISFCWLFPSPWQHGPGQADSDQSPPGIGCLFWNRVGNNSICGCQFRGSHNYFLFVAWCYFWCHRPLARAERRCQGPRGSGPAWLWFLAGIPVDWKSKSQPHGALVLQRAMRCALCCPLFAFLTSCSFRIFLI